MGCRRDPHSTTVPRELLRSLAPRPAAANPFRMPPPPLPARATAPAAPAYTVPYMIVKLRQRQLAAARL